MELSWAEIWGLIYRGLRRYDERWINTRLWDLRFASWILSLESDNRTCRYCGAVIETTHARAAYCSTSTACRKAAYRARQTGQPTPLEEAVVDARKVLAEIRSEAASGIRMLRRAAKNPTATPAINPPDWTRIDHVPTLPRRCEGGCALGPCSHTGSVCLYAHTSPIPPPSEEP